MMSERLRSLLVLNGIGVICAGVFLAGWLYFFFLFEGIRLFPFIEFIAADVPGDRRAWNMAHLEGITNGLLLIATAAAAPYVQLSQRGYTILFWSSLAYAWMFTLPAIANAVFDTRGLAFGGTPFEPSLANDIIFMSGWPAMIGVHIALPLFAWGVWRHIKSLGD